MESAAEEPEIGKYRHFKGGIYEVIAIALDCENPERKMVIYKSLYDNGNFPIGTVWKRELIDFVGFKETDGGKVKRFEKI
ncbi:MAG: DUF1653 domain-containing protein [Candidatus Pacearchaeota archaeon]